ncbi:ROK family protein [Microbacterium sp.]|uniref:ROK family transcriptional regulator n=1 Tax=Microbacterium sp. TaxID=51671 RepID=UPI003A87D202
MTEVTRAAGLSAPGAGEIFQILRAGRAFTKAELVAATGLARSTVSLRVDALLSSGLAMPAGEGASTGGRPPARIAFNPRAGFILALDLGATHVTVGLADLSGTVLAADAHPLDIGRGPEPVLDEVMDRADTLLAGAPQSAASLVGVGIGVPGPVDQTRGCVTNPPIMPGWDGFDIPRYVRDRYGVRVFVDNDVNILALGEHTRSWPGVSDLIYVKVATGIGAGIVAGGVLQRGARGSAGDIGHLSVPETAGVTRPADGGDLESIANGASIARTLREQGLDAVSSGDVVDLVRAGDRRAIAATREAGRAVGAVLAMVVNVLNPSVLVIGGRIGRAGEHLLAGVREVVYQKSLPLATQHLDIVQTKGGSTAGAHGAAILVAQHILDPHHIGAFHTLRRGERAAQLG